MKRKPKSSVAIRIDSQDKEKIERYFEATSMAERIHQLVENYEKARPFLKSVEPESLKELTNAYPNTPCTLCHRYILVGEKSLWGRDLKGNPIRICIDCQINSETDKTIVKRLIRKKKLEREIKALENRHDSLIVAVEDKTIKEEIGELVKSINELHEQVDSCVLHDNITESIWSLCAEKFGEDLILANEGAICDFNDAIAKEVGIDRIDQRIELIHRKVMELSAFFEGRLYKKAIKSHS